MDAREDFMVMRRAAAVLNGGQLLSQTEAALGTLLRSASAKEVSFIRLAKAGIQAEVIDLAYAILGEERSGGPAVTKEAE